MRLIYAGIGSLRIPDAQIKRLKEVARLLAEGGCILRSGASSGVEAAFIDGASACEDVRVEVFLPWKGFNGSDSLNCWPSAGARLIAQMAHPAPDLLKQSHLKLHARCVHEMLGKNLNSPAHFVLCWSPNGEPCREVKLALDIAKRCGIVVINLGAPGLADWSAKRIVRKAVTASGTDKYWYGDATTSS